jgi:2-hydroxychromene-2-carboxylate isomerase
MQLEFYFDVGSPTAYLAWCRLEQLVAGHGLSVVKRPMLLGGVFKAAGSASPVSVPAKGRYMLEQDLPRFAARYGVPLNFSPHFPINTLTLMRGVFAARDACCEDAYVATVFRAIWVDAANMGDPAIVRATLEKAGLDAQALMEGCAKPAVKQALIEATEEAVARGVFGAPTMFIGDDMFFGQDRLDFVEERLSSDT